MVAFSLVWMLPAAAKSAQRGLALAPALASPSTWGTYHALIIGINDFEKWPRLQTAVKDATVIRETLINRYGFNPENIILRIDRQASRIQIIQDLRYLALSMGAEDNLLVYFAGHGQLDDFTGDGYWVPAEGELKSPGTWVANSFIKAVLSSERLRAKNVVVIADSCYSGSMLRGGPSLMSLQDRRYKEKLAQKAALRSRQVISSGGVEPVADGGAEGHSLFAYYLIDALRKNNREVIDLENLFHTRVWKKVTEIGDQRPNVGRLKTPMDQDGQFVLYNAAWSREQARRQAAQEEKRQAQARAKAAFASAELELQRQRIEIEKQRLAMEKEQLAQEQTIALERLKLEKQKQEIEHAKFQARMAKMQRTEEKGVPTHPGKESQAGSKPALLAAVTQSREATAPDRKVMLASVFPFHIVNTAGIEPEQHLPNTSHSCFLGLVRFIQRNRLGRLVMLYETDRYYHSDVVVSGTVIPKDDIDLIWRKPSFFSNKVEPHIESIDKYVKESGTSMAVLIRYRLNTQRNMKLHLYMINPANGKVVTRVTEKHWRIDWKMEVAQLAEAAYAEYQKTN